MTSLLDVVRSSCVDVYAVMAVAPAILRPRLSFPQFNSTIEDRPVRRQDPSLPAESRCTPSHCKHSLRFDGKLLITGVPSKNIESCELIFRRAFHPIELDQELGNDLQF